MKLFWKFGYEATSMSDLRASLGLTQASIYAAFGSKEQLFREAVELYQRTSGATTARALADSATARLSVEVMLRDAVREFTRAGIPAGCLVVLGTMNCSTESKPLQDHLRSIRLHTTKALAERIRRGQFEGEVPAYLKPEEISEYFATVLHGLSIQARDGASAKALRGVVDCAMAAWDHLTSSKRQSTMQQRLG